MLEKEIKILEINKEKVIEKLLSFGAKKKFEWYIHDVYYDFPSETNMENMERRFRIRKKWEEHLYTIKKREEDDHLKVAQEGEFTITNVEGFKKVLAKYGMKETREKSKYRVTYEIDDFVFEIDEYEWIPAILEIEGSSYLNIKLWIEKLELSHLPQKRFGARGLFKYYQKLEKEKQKFEKQQKKLKIETKSKKVIKNKKSSKA